jgi:hypothetical protein
MTPVEILKAARELIAKPERWTQSTVARDARGKSVFVSSPDAVCWCAAAALLKVTTDRDEDGGSLDASREALLKNAGGFEYICDFNDVHGRTHAEVLALFDAAIASAQS